MFRHIQRRIFTRISISLRVSCVNISIDLICSVRTVITLFEYQHWYAGLCYGVWGHGPKSIEALHQTWWFSAREAVILQCHSNSRHAGDWISTPRCQLGSIRPFFFPLGMIYFGVKVLIAEDWFYRQQGMPPPCCSGFACWLSIFLSAFTHEQTFT